MGNTHADLLSFIAVGVIGNQSKSARTWLPHCLVLVDLALSGSADYMTHSAGLKRQTKERKKERKKEKRKRRYFICEPAVAVGQRLKSIIYILCGERQCRAIAYYLPRSGKRKITSGVVSKMLLRLLREIGCVWWVLLKRPFEGSGKTGQRSITL